MTIPKAKSSEWHEARRRYIGGSDANIIMTGTDEQRNQLWLVKTGKAQPDDLEDVFQVQLGTFTEAFNLAWFVKKSGVTLVQNAPSVASQYDWMRCQPDGLTADAIIECKHTNERLSTNDVIARYQAQLHHNMICTGRTKAFLSVIKGNTYDYAEVEFDSAYADALIAAERDFWDACVFQLPPGGAPAVAPPEPFRVVDMTGSNEWAAAAADWFSHFAGNAAFNRAANTLRSLVPGDAKSASGHGIVLKRDKRGALRISEVK